MKSSSDAQTTTLFQCRPSMSWDRLFEMAKVGVFVLGFGSRVRDEKD
jgi:hypothetical protein